MLPRNAAVALPRSMPIGSSAPPSTLWTLVLILLFIVSSYSEQARFSTSLPIRTVVCVPLFLAVLLQSSSQRRRIISARVGWILIGLWALLIAWIFIATVVNGGSVMTLLRKIVGRHFTAFVAMLAIVWCTRGRLRHQRLVLVLAALIMFSGLIAIMQWLGQDWAWNLRKIMNVPADAVDLDMMVYEPAKTLVSGLYNTAFTCSYFMVVGVLVLLPFTLDAKWRFIIIGPLLITCLALIIVQERSAVLAAGLCGLCFFFEMIRHAKGRMLNILLLMAMMTVGATYSAVWVARQVKGNARYSIDRYSDFSSESRVIAAQTALTLAEKHPIFGVAGDAFSSVSGLGSAPTPHNLFFNALVYHGVPGLLLSLAIAGVQTWLAWTVWRMAWRRNDYASIGCAMAMIGYLLNCQFHNASMLNGDHLGWWITGFLIASRQNYMQESLAFRSPNPAMRVS